MNILDYMDTIPGWFTIEEAKCLRKWAREAPEGARVELGSYCGRSTVAMADVCPMYAIDPHGGDMSCGIQHDSTWDRFNRYIEPYRENITVIKKCSFQVQWTEPVGLFFHDAAHDEQSVKRDFKQFQPHLVPGAICLFHDYGDKGQWYQVKIAVDQLPLQWVEQVGSIGVFRYQ